MLAREACGRVWHGAGLKTRELHAQRHLQQLCRPSRVQLAELQPLGRGRGGA